MIAISSHRALADSLEIAENQFRAKRSWELVFDAIVYFGPTEPLLNSAKTSFVEIEDFPTMSALFFAASKMDDFSCIINADIVTAPHLPGVVASLGHKGMAAVTSRRWEFNGDNIERAELKDWGVDFFGAWPSVWRQAWREVPPSYRIGHNAWDSWLLGFMNTKHPKSFWDISRQACIYHPRHNERKRAYPIVPVPGYDGNCGFPVLRQ